jgi:hypothetical protein
MSSYGNNLFSQKQINENLYILSFLVCSQHGTSLQHYCLKWISDIQNARWNSHVCTKKSVGPMAATFEIGWSPQSSDGPWSMLSICWPPGICCVTRSWDISVLGLITQIGYCYMTLAAPTMILLREGSGVLVAEPLWQIDWTIGHCPVRT